MMGSLPQSRMVLSYHIPTQPCMMGKILLANLPQLLQLFLINPVLLIKIYLKLQINLSHQLKLIFSKN